MVGPWVSQSDCKHLDDRIDVCLIDALPTVGNHAESYRRAGRRSARPSKMSGLVSERYSKSSLTALAPARRVASTAKSSVDAVEANRRLDGVVILELKGHPRIVQRHHQLMELLARDECRRACAAARSAMACAPDRQCGSEGIFGTNTSPPCMRAKLCRSRNCDAVIKRDPEPRHAFGSVIGSSLAPSAISLLKNGTTEPREPATLP
jgi:hypothetical protein